MSDLEKAAYQVLEVIGYTVGSEFDVRISDKKKAALALRKLANALDEREINRIIDSP